jgi:hypothetical protein
MINIVCVKIGTKYESIYANTLYRMCADNISQPFNFFCYTDNPDGLDPNIRTLPFINHDIKQIVFNKLFLLSDQFASWIGNDPTFFFDLDVVIKSNIDGFINRSKATDTFKVINAVWKTLTKEDTLPPYLDHTVNSSCMFWVPGTTDYIWNSFFTQKEALQKIYWRGMDGFLFYEHNIRGGLPEDSFYSFLYDIDRKIKRIITSPEEYKKVKASIPIVLFNGPTTQEDIDTFIKNNYESDYLRFGETFVSSLERKKEIQREIDEDMKLRQLSMSSHISSHIP